MQKKCNKILAVFLTMLIVVGALPLSVFAAPAADIPKDMLDNTYLDALAYTGYNVQAAKNDGTIFKKYGGAVNSSILSGIKYDSGFVNSGTETVAKSGTATGRAPDIAKFKKSGLCCAAYVSYVYSNYLPNIAGIDTSKYDKPTNPKSSSSWDEAAKKWVASGLASTIPFTQSSDGKTFSSSEEIPIGSLIVFKASGTISHVGIYAGAYGNKHFITHVGNDRGPEIIPLEGLIKNGSPELVTSIYVPEFTTPEEYGQIKVQKKDTEGKNLSGAVFVATNTADNSRYTIGPTDINGYAESTVPLPLGTYKVTETVYPTNYRGYGQTEWTVTLSKENNNGTVVINAVNELIPGSAKIVKTSEDGKVEGISFTITGNGVNKTVTTDKNGEIIIDNLKPGVYKVTELTSDKYEPQEARDITIVSGQTATVTFNNTLKRGDLKVTKTSEDGLNAGVKFHLFGTSVSGLPVDEYAVTDNSGVATFKDVLIGAGYTLEEIDTDNRYLVPDNQTATVEWNKVTNKTFNNVLKRGELTVTKTSEDGLVEGMKFHLFGTSLSGLAVDEYAVTDKNGIATFNNVLIGSGYTLEEVNTPSRYVIPDSQTTAVEWGNVTNNTFHNVLKKFNVTVTKTDKETGTPQGDGTLAGAVYGIYKGNQLIDTYTTDINGQFTTKYYICGDDWTIREIKPSEGYLLDNTSYHIGAEPQLYTIEYNSTLNGVQETVKKGKISVIKHCDDGSTQIETPEEGAEFEVFLKSAGSYDKAKDSERSILVCDKFGYAETKYLPYGTYTVKQTKGWDGKQLMPAFDVYVSENGEVYRYLINNATFKSLVEIVKKDVETGKIIPAAGVGFKVRDLASGEFVVQHINYPTPMDIDTFYTDSTGKLMMPEALPYGKYEIVEVQTCYGYVLDSTPVPFTIDGTQEVVTVEKHNIAQKGTITISKSGEVFSSVTETDGIYQPIYSVKGLAGAVYEVRASEDIVPLDGTLRYKKGELVSTVTTDKNGKATTEPLYLGKYEIKEIKAPDGMVINTEPQAVELVYAGQNVAVTSTSAEFYNERQKAEIELAKLLELDELFGIGNNGEILAVSFGLYADEDIVSADGKVIPKDALLEIVSCDKDGNIKFTTDIPVGAKLYVKEYTTDEHYVISDKAYPVIFEYAGQDTAIVRISVNDGNPINNELIYGEIRGKKTDDEGNALGGAVIGLFREDCTDFTTENALMTATSEEDGSFSFANVPFGKWIVREISAPDGYILSDEAYLVAVQNDGAVIELEIVNKIIRGTVQITKTDKDFPDNKLTGAEFTLYRDSNGNKVFDKTDELIGTLSEVQLGIYELYNLAFGGYFVKETKAPEGFNPDTKAYYFEITNDGETVIVENEEGKGFVNEAKTGTLKIVKTSDDGKVKGFSFRVTGPYGYDEIFITDENGEIIIEGLRLGDYVISEIANEASAPYVLPADKTATVFEDATTKVEMVNTKKQVEIPPTSAENIGNMYFASASVALFVSCLIIGTKRKKHTKKSNAK